MSINLNTKFWNFSHRGSYQKVLIDSCMLYNKLPVHILCLKKKNLSIAYCAVCSLISEMDLCLYLPAHRAHEE